MENFYKNYYQMFNGIELCINQKLQLPALTLIYSTIDSLSWLAYGDIGGNKVQFTKWVDEYMDNEKLLDITSLDLYSARCAIIHTLTPNSKRSNKKEASVLCYAWGDANRSLGEKSIEKSGINGLKIIHINDLFESLKIGTLKFTKNDNLNKNTLDRMTQHYTNISKEELNKFIKLT